MIDLHAHIIPNVDDGSKDYSQTYDMLTEALKAGFTTIVSTSHYIEESYNIENKERQESINKINKYIEENRLDLKVYLGSEIYITPNIIKLIEDKKVSTLGNSKYVLFELPMNTNVKYLDDIIFELRSNGYIPVIAHPERYMIVQENPNIVQEWIEKGAFMQGNFTSIIGYYGKRARMTMKKLLKSNMIHFLGTDAHNKNQYQRIEKTLLELEKYIGKEKLDIIINQNPLCIIEDREFLAPKVKKIKKLWFI